MIHTHFPFVAVQTPWTEKFLDNRSSLTSTSIATGPLLFSEKDPSRDYQALRETSIVQTTTRRLSSMQTLPLGGHFFILGST